MKLLRILALFSALSLLAAACGDDDTADAGPADSTEVDDTAGDEVTPDDDTSDAVDEVPDDDMSEDETTDDDTDEEAAPPDGATFAAENGIPVPDWMEIGGLVELETGELALAAEYNVPPPPGYDAALTAAGYEILDTQFGSIFYVAHHVDWGCLFALVDYENAQASGGWVKAIRIAGSNKDDCPTLADEYKSALANVEYPFTFFVG